MKIVLLLPVVCLAASLTGCSKHEPMPAFAAVDAPAGAAPAETKKKDEDLAAAHAEEASEYEAEVREDARNARAAGKGTYELIFPSDGLQVRWLFTGAPGSVALDEVDNNVVMTEGSVALANDLSNHIVEALERAGVDTQGLIDEQGTSYYDLLAGMNPDALTNQNADFRKAFSTHLERYDEGKFEPGESL